MIMAANRIEKSEMSHDNQKIELELFFLSCMMFTRGIFFGGLPSPFQPNRWDQIHET